MATISGTKAGQIRGEFDFERKQLLRQLIEKGMTSTATNGVGVKSMLMSRIIFQQTRLEINKDLTPSFEKRAGKKVDTSRIFERVIQANSVDGGLSA